MQLDLFEVAGGFCARHIIERVGARFICPRESRVVFSISRWFIVREHVARLDVGVNRISLKARVHVHTEGKL